MNNYFEENPDMKKIIFFAFYLVFFIIIIFILRSGTSRSDDSLTKYNSGINKTYSLNDIMKDNYHFNYNIKKNNQEIIIDGDILKNKQEFIISGNPSMNYYSENEKYFIRNNNTLTYEETNNPLEFYNFVKSDNLEKIIRKSTYISVTNYFDNKSKDYNYEISTTTLLKLLDNLDVDLDDKVNTIKVKTDENDNVYEIDMNISSYYNYIDSSINNYQLIITFSKIGNVSNINIKK